MRFTSLKETLLYGLRWLASFLILEIMLQVFHIQAIVQRKAWDGFSAADFGSIGYLSLKQVWLKASSAHPV